MSNSTSQPSTKSTSVDSVAEFCGWYLVRLGVHGQVGRLGVTEVGEFHRGARVVCRTARGVEVGLLLGPSGAAAQTQDADGRILRNMTSEDELLWQHLESLSGEAYTECQSRLNEFGIAAKLIEVEPLLDGRTIYFHFLSQPEEKQALLQTQLDALASAYEKQVRESKFAQLLEHGCGPGCGTEDAKNGCGSKGGCAVCKIAKACKA